MYRARIGGGSFGEVYEAWPYWYFSSIADEWRRVLDDQPAVTQIATYMRRCLEALLPLLALGDRDGLAAYG